MKKQDFIVIALVLLFFAPFFAIDSVGELYRQMNAEHPYFLAFLKFGILSTFGEMLAYRIRTGHYCSKNFGLLPKAIMWGLFGVWIAYAMKVFVIGVPKVVEGFGVEGVVQAMGGDFTALKLLGAFCISVSMNFMFAPVFMTLHKVSDTHIASHQGAFNSLFKKIKMGSILSSLNWDVQWNFVFKKTLPLFWVPAHTITFILPSDYQVLFAALLGIPLGLILAIASLKGNKQ